MFTRLSTGDSCRTACKPINSLPCDKPTQQSWQRLGKSDLEWYILHGSAESFMNADTKDDEVNVVMKRTMRGHMTVTVGSGFL